MSGPRVDRCQRPGVCCLASGRPKGLEGGTEARAVAEGRLEELYT